MYTKRNMEKRNVQNYWIYYLCKLQIKKTLTIMDDISPKYLWINKVNKYIFYYSKLQGYLLHQNNYLC